MKAPREQRDFFYWMNRVFPWFFGAVFVFVLVYAGALIYVTWSVASTAADMGAIGVAESLGRLWGAFIKGASQ